ncbi:hypothetical protein [Desulfovibrio legallii]|jgi:hypothetical protein|uniref:Uncharacterized protein n=1 Tax=Desulfovibrio legallii TaxID=571438 RepID=A0A1G7MIE4_9BACT|nr:hypothetical protein [Desulfovibrio legallii]SDF61454.1 hypothetical protein SAMN05192586_10910 [Desulfovibrio legallii]
MAAPAARHPFSGAVAAPAFGQGRRAARFSALLLAAFVALGGLPGAGGTALAASAYSPRQSGLEPPGGPRATETLPGQSASRTAEGGMGHTDAYGNTVTPREPEAPKARKRLNPGAYGATRQAKDERPLPDPEPRDQTPVWNFR